MSTDNNDKTKGLLANPLPILMVALLAGSLLVKNVQLESARPTEPERVKFTSTTHQDVEARLWQDPLAAVEKAVEKYEDIELANASRVPGLQKTEGQISEMQKSQEHTPGALQKHISALDPNTLTVVAVSVFGGSFVEAAEWRRRSRFAVISALGFHNYFPVNADAIGYFRTHLADPDGYLMPLNVPFEWYKREELNEPSTNVLVLWLDEDKFAADPLGKLQAMFNELTPAFYYRGCSHPLQLSINALWLDEKKFTTTPLEKLQPLFKGLTPPSDITFSVNCNDYLNVKLVGPAGSTLLVKLMKPVTYVNRVLALKLDEKEFTTTPLEKLQTLFNGLAQPPYIMLPASSDSINLKPVETSMLTQNSVVKKNRFRSKYSLPPRPSLIATCGGEMTVSRMG